MTKLKCPSCGWKVNERHPEKYIGKYFNCPNCGTELTVIEDEGAYSLEIPKGTKVCPECGEPIVIPVKGIKVKCPNCGEILAEFPNCPKGCEVDG